MVCRTVIIAIGFSVIFAGSAAAQPTENLARTAATNRLEAGTKALCDNAARNIDGQVLQVKRINTNMACEPLASGWICQASAEAECTIAEPVQTNWCHVNN